MKNLWCKIVGHSYHMSDIETHYSGGVYTFIHTCCRCGKRNCVMIDERYLVLPPQLIGTEDAT